MNKSTKHGEAQLFRRQKEDLHGARAQRMLKDLPALAEQGWKWIT